MIQATPPLPELEGRVTLTVNEAARVLGLGRSATYEACRRGELPNRRVGRRILIPVAALIEWLNGDTTI